MEILSPARNMDTVIAAVRSGANAVYIGAKNFSARMMADNFSLDEIQECVKYCHKRDVKVYLTVNTLIFDEEFNDALELVKEAAIRDIDAVIVQDLGLSYAIHKMIPNLRLHASTQMSVHTVCGVKQLEKCGFTRVVLSRELSREEIKRIHEACPNMELEVFVHGALCMCMSGQCYFSSMLGGRSANRGMCAQPCRLPFSVSSKGTHALSLKDNSIVDKLKDLSLVGVFSAKIEGRMKRPEYVAAATKACSEVNQNGKMSSITKNEVESVFSRSGFTSGYYDSLLGPSMFGIRQKEDVVSATNELLKQIRNEYRLEKQTVPISFKFVAHYGENAVLLCGDKKVFSEDVVEKAIKVPITKERIKENLLKTGNTQYLVENIECDIDEDISIQISVINKMRRQVLDLLDAEREKKNNYEIYDIDDVLNIKDDVYKDTDSLKWAVTTNLEIPEDFIKYDIVFVDINGMSDIEKLKELQNRGISIGIEIPRAMFSNEQQIINKLKRFKELNINDVLCHNIASVYFAKELDFTIHGGFGLNIANSMSIYFLKYLGVNDTQLSIELSINQINKLRRYIPVGMAVYGYMPLMLTRNCPAKGAGFTCENCKKEHFLQDRKDIKFPILCRTGYTEILNSVPLILSQKIYKEININFTVFHFYVENSVKKKKKTDEKLSKNLDLGMLTRGLSVKGVKKFTYF